MKKYTLPLIFAIGSMLFAQSKVGVGTDSPKATLDIEGDLKIETLNDASTEAEPLYRNDSGDQIIMKGGENKVFVPLKYIFYMDDRDADWLNGFNTGIKTSEYNLILGSSLLTYQRIRNDKEEEVPASIYLVSEGGTSPLLASVKQAYVEGKDGYWWIYADFSGARPYKGDAQLISGKALFTWEIQVLAIDAKLSTSL